jgi:hypothetical protein
MRPFKTADVVILGTCFFLLEAVLPRNAAAYVDPGTTGMLSQILYVLFYGALGVFFYCLRYVKGYIASLKEFLAKCFGRNT